MPISQRLRIWLKHCKQSILTYNVIYSSRDPLPDEYETYTQIISTRLYIVLFLVSIFIFGIYTSQVKVTERIDIQNPTYDQYLNLYKTYSQTLSCPCTAISISYEQFINITVSFHQVCHSVYVTLVWRDLIDSTASIDQKSTFFRHIGAPLFQVLSSLCNLTSKLITDGLIDFYATQFITGKAISDDVFVQEINELIRFFITSTTESFTRSLDMIRDITHASGFTSGLMTNVEFTVKPTPNSPSRKYEIQTHWTVFSDVSSNCSCEDTPLCTVPAYVDDNRLFRVPGILTGCYIVEALLQSNLICFYNQPCIDNLRHVLDSKVKLNTTALDPTISSRYKPNTILAHIIANLMVEHWTNTTSHKDYYHECNPVTCSYTYVGKNSWFVVIITIIGITSVLSTILKIVVYRFVKILRSCLRSSTDEQHDPVLREFVFIYKLLLTSKRRSAAVEYILQTSHSISSAFFLLSEKFNSLYLLFNIGISLKDRIQTLWSKLKTFLLELNLFSSEEAVDDYEIRTEIITTRCFLVTLIISFVVLAIYTLRVPILKVNQIQSPPYGTYMELYKGYPESLSCSCENIGIRYDQFMHVDVRFHQVCASDFVKDIYFLYLSRTIVKNSAYTGQSALRLIASWCRLANLSFVNDHAAFGATQFTTNEVINIDLFDKQVRSLIHVFTTSTANTFIRTLAMVREITYSNSLFTAFSTNLYPVINGIFPNLSVTISAPYYFESNCSCMLNATCTTPITFPSGSSAPTVSGLEVGCFVNEATLQSTLACYYNQRCVDTLHSLLGATVAFNATALDPTLDSQFNTSSLISSLVIQMMAENWTYTSSHESFYNQCKPFECVFSYEGNNGFFEACTILMELAGGLTMIIEFLIPRLIKRLRKRSLAEEQRQLEGLPQREKFRRLWVNAKESMRKYTVFHSASLNVEDIAYKRRTDIISTRIYLFLLVISLGIFVIYISQISILKAVTVEKPSYENYSHLNEHFHQSLSCPCTNISNLYDRFIQVKVVHFHEVCRSVYATAEWSSFLLRSRPADKRIDGRDFRGTAAPWFQALGSFCNLARTTIDDEIIRFNAQHFVTSHVITLDSFEKQSQALIQSFIASITNAFLRSLQLMRDTTQGNGLISARQTNVVFTLDVLNGKNIIFEAKYKNYTNHSSKFSCSCKKTPFCVGESSIYEIPGPAASIIPKNIFTVPGILTGCYIVEALLQSNLICFYNQSCIDNLRHVLNSTNKINTTALDSTISSRYKPNTIIGHIIGNLMVEQWTNTTSHKNYYIECHPVTCTYTYVGKNSWFVVITTTIGVFGGLTTILKFLVPLVIRILRSFCKQRVAPLTNE